MYKSQGCRILSCVVCMAVAIVVGGVILWLFLPDASKTSIASGLVNAEEPDYLFSKCGPETVECCNGLDSVCHLRVDEIMYAGIHNGMATRENGFLVGSNHELGLEKALTAGYRAINLDIGKCDGELKLIHGLCALGGRDPAVAFGNIVTFLENNPTEVVIINLQVVTDTEGENENRVVSLDEMDSLVKSVPGMSDRMYSHPKRSDPWPTLGEMKEAGKQILFFHYNMEDICYRDQSCPEGFHDWFLYAEETEYSFRNVEEVENSAKSCLVTRGSTKSTFFAVNQFVTPSSKSASLELNSLPFLQNHIPACSEENRGKLVNVVFVDHWSAGNLPLYVQRRNRIRGLSSKQKLRFRNYLRA